MTLEFRAQRSTRLLASAVVAVALVTGGVACAAVAPPANAEYPALVLPARASPPHEAEQPGTALPSRATSPTGTAATTSSAGVVAPTGTATATRTIAPQGDQPDPQPLSERAQWSYPVVYDKGNIRVGEPEPLCLQRPQPTLRRIGRFAFELWLGRELIDRVRFDFPLLATEEPPSGPRRPLRETPRFAPGAHVSVTVRIPASDRAATARIFDRATGDSIAVPWPPRSSDDVARPRPCPPAGPRAGSPAKPPASSDAGR